MTQHEEHEHHLVPIGIYIGVWLALLAGTAITVGVSYVDFGHVSILVALIVASVKGTLVLLYFMNLRYEKPIFAYMFLAVGCTYAVFIVLTFADYSYRLF
jgi:cytochrome c oxidase subunit 4